MPVAWISQATIYPEGDGFAGALSLGFDGQGRRQRIKRRARTKAAVKDKLIQVVAEREAGLKTAHGYTVADAVRDWLGRGLKDRDPHTVATYRILAEQHVLPLIGGIKLTELTADQVDDWLDGLSGTLASSSLHKVHAILNRAIRQAQARDRVLRNVAELVSTPRGTLGRPSRAMTFEQATAMLEHARASRMQAYVVVSLLTGIRTEEARALRWSHVVAWVAEAGEWQPVTETGFDHDRFAIYVWRSVRASGDTKTRKSRRTLELPSRRRSAQRAPDSSDPRTAGSRPAVARPGHGVHQPDRGAVGRGERPPGVQVDHRPRRPRNRLDAARAAAFLRIHHERQRRKHSGPLERLAGFKW